MFLFAGYNSGVHVYALCQKFSERSVSLSLRHENLTLLRLPEFISFDAVDIITFIFCICNKIFLNGIRTIH